jgi:hypothetical protein
MFIQQRMCKQKFNLLLQEYRMEYNKNSVAFADPEPDVFRHARSGSIHWYEVRIRILLSSSENIKKNLDCCCFVTFVTSLLLFIFEK